jgi:NADH-quinone oxidoreductase subunit M
MTEFSILPVLMFAPTVGATIILLTPSGRKNGIRLTAAASTAVSLVLSLWLLVDFTGGEGGYRYVTRIPWVRDLGISFFVGLDGIGLAMVLLTAAVVFAGVFVSWSIEERVKEHYALLLVLVTGVFGVFASLDLFFFYFFYELAVIPMYLLIGIWGTDDKEYCSMKLVLYLTVGALFALIGLFILYFTAAEELGYLTFSLVELEGVRFDPGFQVSLFPLIFLGFAVLVPMWPFHTWSPLGHASAPAAVSMLHAGVLMKLGAFGIIRIAMNLLPAGAAEWMPWVAVICVFNILYGGWVAMAQNDTKYIIGYSSSSHMGYVLLGLACFNVTAMNGAVLMMFAHGIMTALVFGLVGFLYHQTHTRITGDLGGLSRKLPFIGVAFAIGALASSGLPGTANFAAEFLIFVGAWKTYPIQTVLAVFGIVITATYMLRAVASIFFGPMPDRWEEVRDATLFREKLPYLLLIAILLILGFVPSLLVDDITSGVVPLVERLQSTAQPLAGPVPGGEGG